MSKDYVGLGYAVCPICGNKHDEVVLFQCSLGAPPKLERENFAGFKLCPEHKTKFDEGYLALVVVTYVPEHVPLQQQYNEAVRTGEIIHIRRPVAKQVFNVAMPDDLPFMWIDPEAATLIKSMVQQ